MGYGTIVLDSFYTEFSPEISLALTKLFVHKSAPKSSPMRQSSTTTEKSK